jgi:pimeloyl-ACP methyl ester carboxylesterase
MQIVRGDLAKLVPNAHYALATKSGHNIHQDHPELVIAAIREVVDAVRNPRTWIPAP